MPKLVLLLVLLLPTDLFFLATIVRRSSWMSFISVVAEAKTLAELLLPLPWASALFPLPIPVRPSVFRNMAVMFCCFVLDG
jgi:uncharacterized membrane-anchored protein YjiN (DUF445 family)